MNTVSVVESSIFFWNNSGSNLSSVIPVIFWWIFSTNDACFLLIEFVVLLYWLKFDFLWLPLIKRYFHIDHDKRHFRFYHQLFFLLVQVYHDAEVHQLQEKVFFQDSNDSGFLGASVLSVPWMIHSDILARFTGFEIVQSQSTSHSSIKSFVRTMVEITGSIYANCGNK